jgi:hypothetical protein
MGTRRESERDRDRGSIDETGLSPRAGQQASIDFLELGAELGAKIHGTELMPRPRHASSHVNDTQKMTLDLGAKAIGAATCKLGVNYHGAKVRVYFFERIPLGRICENLSKKGLKSKKKIGEGSVGLLSGWALPNMGNSVPTYSRLWSVVVWQKRNAKGKCRVVRELLHVTRIVLAACALTNHR